jgi:hypothetical protein
MHPTKFVANNYSSYVLVDAQTVMDALEDEAQLVREFKDVEEVETEVGDIILKVGCTRTRNYVFFGTVEIYWHIKTLFSLGLLPKDEDFRKLEGRMEALEFQNSYISETLPWMATLGTRRDLLPPERHYSSQESSNVSF